MGAKVATSLAAAVLVFGGGVAKLAHLGPFADDVVRSLDTVAMSATEFRGNYVALRTGTLAEKQGVEVACALFTSMASTGDMPAQWDGFANTLADRMGVTSADEYMTGKLSQLQLAVELAERNVRAATEYAKACIF